MNTMDFITKKALSITPDGTYDAIWTGTSFVNSEGRTTTTDTNAVKVRFNFNVKVNDTFKECYQDCLIKPKTIRFNGQTREVDEVTSFLSRICSATGTNVVADAMKKTLKVALTNGTFVKPLKKNELDDNIEFEEELS